MSRTTKRSIKGAIWAIWILTVMFCTIGLLENAIGYHIASETGSAGQPETSFVPATITEVPLAGDSP